MSGKVLRRRRSGGGRRTVTTVAARESVDLDDCPLAITRSRDGKRLFVALPYEVTIIHARTLESERSIPLPAAAPSVAEASQDGALWLGGHHLHSGSSFETSQRKVGTRLSGYVDRICLVRPGLLCGIGSQGEVLWDLSKSAAVHRRKIGEHATFGLLPLGGRAIFADGSPSAWMIEPEHPGGYTQLRFRSTSPVPSEREGIVAIGTGTRDRCLLAARDGGVAWLASNLRLEGERFPRDLAPRQATPLAIAGDARWIYVLRTRGLLHRFLLEQPKVHPSDPDQEPPMLPEAQECRLKWPASAMVLLRSSDSDNDNDNSDASDTQTRLLLGGPQADGLLGRLWRADPEALEWRELSLGHRELLPAPAKDKDKDKDAAPSKREVPDFTPTKTKISGSPLAELKVDTMLAERDDVLITSAHGSLLERPFTRVAADQVMPADTVILPAMIRPREGVARPALLLWPGTRDRDREPAPPHWLVWGDSPRGWMALETPQIREQGWSRPNLFPMQVALAQVPKAAGNRAALGRRYADAKLFRALASECKHLLKVLW